VYKHVVLGLIFLKYVSDAFEERQNELNAQFRDSSHDYYTEQNVFWVPVEARWQTLRDCAQLENDPRWVAGTPPQGNANFAWLQHMLYHLALIAEDKALDKEAQTIVLQ
jgi:type I restriction enzyme M protein